ncbi:hypothetical protein N7540_008172 [Penicillium herquei]|nr:hypothetical protein N7540_008172 [Penicillium herquei]
MALPLNLFIPPCIHTPATQQHNPPPDQPLRISIEGPIVAIKRLFPHVTWNLEEARNFETREFPQRAGPELARLAFQALYGRDARSDVVDDLVVRDEILGWIDKKPHPEAPMDYYGVTFDHLVPGNDTNPEVLQINITEVEDDGGICANTWLLFPVDPVDYIRKKVLAVPRCCQKRKGTQDRGRVNMLVDERVNNRRH